MRLPHRVNRTARAEACFFEGTRLLAAQDLRGAESSFREAVRLCDSLSEAHGNLGFVLDALGQLQESEVCFRKSIALNPNLLETHLNLGSLLMAQKRFTQAQDSYQNALMLKPHAPAVWSNLGTLYISWNNDAEAERCLRHALTLDNSYAKARFNLAYVLLRQGQFEEGWDCLEARDWYVPLARYLECPRWAGEPLMGKSLLIGYEAGHGDMVQFCRYAAVLKAQGAGHITLMCHPALKRLFGSLVDDGVVDTVYAYNEAIPRSGWDYWTPPMSIPFHHKTRLDTLPARLPYLQARTEDVAHWQTLMPPRSSDNRLRVGLVWKGNPQFENDADRSLSGLEVLAPLGNIPGVGFVSLQKGEGENQAQHPPVGLAVLDLGSRMADFADAAAIITNLDMVITVDTAMAHLAGALGKPCWVMLPSHKTDWRWLTERSDSPWYPGVMRLFRQLPSAHWSTVVADMHAALMEIVTRSDAIS